MVRICVIVAVAWLAAWDEGWVGLWDVSCDVILEDCDLIVMHDADAKFGSVGCEHISAALRELTGLQELYLDGTCLHDCGFSGGVN